MSDGLHPVAVYFAARGLPFASVDVRGRGNSEGLFHPHIHEAKDGYDVVEWLALQSYCNGKVGMYGGSYLGYAQWATVKELPSHLSTIIPTASPCMAVDAPMRNNISYPYNIQWLCMTNGRTYQAKLGNDSAFWTSLYRRWHESGRPFQELDLAFGKPSPVFREDLRHPEPDPYWDAQNPTAAEYGRLDIPILTITGSYDDDQPGALEHYKRHIEHASPASRSRHYLLIGPWDHFGAQLPCAEFGGLRVGPASVIDIHKLHLEWYAWAMQGGQRPQLLQENVGYYVMGADLWRYAQTLEAATSHHEEFFLDSRTNASDVYSSGSLTFAPATGQPDSYTYDPRDTGGFEVDAEVRSDGKSLVDQSVTMALTGKMLIYHSAPFQQEIEITGFFKLVAWISIDCPDTDFYVSIHEITPDGGSVRLSTDAMRARYREGLRTPKLVSTTDPLRYVFDRFTFVSRQIKRGSRLRLVIAPVGRLVEGVFAQKNYNSGGVVAEESASDGRAVTVMLHHTQMLGSVLSVPIGRPREAV